MAAAANTTSASEDAKSLDSLTCPSAQGSDIHHSDRSWGLTSFLAPSSTSANSKQSLQTQPSPCVSHLYNFPGSLTPRNFLQEMEKALVEELHYKLLEMERVFNMWEKVTSNNFTRKSSTATTATNETFFSAKSHISSSSSSVLATSTITYRLSPSDTTTIIKITEDLLARAITIEKELRDERIAAAARAVAETMDESGISFNLDFNKKDGICRWFLLLDDVIVMRGQIEDEEELWTAAFYAGCQKQLEASCYFRRSWR